MANYAKVENTLVTQVIVAEAEFFDTFVDSSPGEWIESTTASIGMKYDPLRSVFIEVKPHASWVLDETANVWNPPVDKPDDGKMYTWDEDTTNWVEIV